MTFRHFNRPLPLKMKISNIDYSFSTYRKTDRILVIFKVVVSLNKIKRFRSGIIEK